jgi:hypothetical protein
MYIRAVRFVRWSICIVLLLVVLTGGEGEGSGDVEVEFMVSLLSSGSVDWGGLWSSMAGGECREKETVGLEVEERLSSTAVYQQWCIVSWRGRGSA